MEFFVGQSHLDLMAVGATHFGDFFALFAFASAQTQDNLALLAVRCISKMRCTTDWPRISLNNPNCNAAIPDMAHTNWIAMVSRPSGGHFELFLEKRLAN
ncbi:MAG: hypothetical protein U9Q82_04660 [Chloroflexota bacterium]|nr:hypothetical protein [Chloroflexota bacterium]